VARDNVASAAVGPSVSIAGRVGLMR
jgi:hypothetical protein